MRKKGEQSDKMKGHLGLDLFSNAPHFEMNSNREVIVEGSRGVLEYSTEIIRINTACMVVAFKGRNLNVKCISPQSLIITGFILSVEFSV